MNLKANVNFRVSGVNFTMNLNGDGAGFEIFEPSITVDNLGPDVGYGQMADIGETGSKGLVNLPDVNAATLADNPADLWDGLGAPFGEGEHDFTASPKSPARPVDRISSRPELETFNTTSVSLASPAKRLRTGWDANSKVGGGRQLSSKADQPAESTSEPYHHASTNPAEATLNYYDPVEYGRFVTATSFTGRTLFVPRRSESAKRFAKRFAASIQSWVMPTHHPLIPESIHSLLDKIELEGRRGSARGPRYDAKGGEGMVHPSGRELWAEKYRPKVYLDLKGDQVNLAVNREALEWLKRWDRCVFPNASRPTPRRLNALRPEDPVQSADRPPGLGKTSLAHVLARHCGYNCIEINASDDRTASVVRDRITTALEMKPVFGERRPNLIVIDEIDGVSSAGGGQNFINLLIQLATGGADAAGGKPANGGLNQPDRGTPKRPKVLRRPIICICNDQFAPALRQLRPHCQIFAFKRLPTAHTVEHLKEVCAQEGITVSSNTLTTLSELTAGDLRSAINSLQFLAESHHRTITYDMVANAQAGLKDSPKSLFAIWDAIFTLPTAHPLATKRALDDRGHATRPLDHLVGTVLTHGGFGILLDGCFEHYLHAKYIDTYMDKLWAAGEWMVWYDGLDLRVSGLQQNGLLAYCPYPVVAFHALFASASPRRVDFPKLDRQFREAVTSNANLLASFFDSLPPTLRRSLPRKGLAKYGIPLSLKILEPDLGRLNLQLLRPAERALLARVVQRMVTLNFRYRPTRSPEGHASYELDPPLHHLATFAKPEAAFKFLPPGRNEVKQYLLHEAEKEALRRKEAIWQARNLAKPNPLASRLPVPAASQASLPPTAPTEPLGSKLASAPPATGDARRLARNNPFAAFKPQPTQRPSRNLVTLYRLTRLEPAGTRKLWFVFLDGYSNAVRTPLLVRDL
ncbi:Chromosome transmission fidelity protein 18 [Massospora cicadina]|nr:Chromosome transmission fidelity protein 18 [Massospora cicadina]